VSSLKGEMTMRFPLLTNKILVLNSKAVVDVKTGYQGPELID
jgi:hypothetical protein